MTRGMVLIVALLGASGCAPTLSSLMAGNHLREVVCAAQEGLEEARPALDAKSDLQVQITVVPDEAIVEYLGEEAGGRLAAKARLVRVRVSTNTLPLDDVSVDAQLSAEGVAAEAPGTVVQERRVEVTKDSPGRYTGWDLLGDMVGGFMTVVTLGALGPIWPWSSRPGVSETTVRTERTHVSLEDFMGEPGCTRPKGEGAGALCSFNFLVSRDAPASMQLNLSTAYEATRLKLSGGDDWKSAAEVKKCRVESMQIVRLQGFIPGVGNWFHVSER